MSSKGLQPRVTDFFVRSYGNQLDKNKRTYIREGRSVSVFEIAFLHSLFMFLQSFPAWHAVLKSYRWGLGRLNCS